MKVLFASAELVRWFLPVGSGPPPPGLVRALRSIDVEVELVIPGYRRFPLTDETVTAVEVPPWVGEGRVRTGTIAEVGTVHVIEVPGIDRPHPYLDSDTGRGWADNDHRFFAWSAAVASLARAHRVDILHANDWHAATSLSHLPDAFGRVLSIHNLAHQGWADPGWEPVLGGGGHAFRYHHAVNAMVGGIRLADRIVAVSPTYAKEITEDAHGMGLAWLLRERGHALVGIVNGIDTDEWDPSTDAALAAPYARSSTTHKRRLARAFLPTVGLEPGQGPLIIGVSRLDWQKGLDLVFERLDVVEHTDARFVLLGSGDPHLRYLAEDAQRRYPRHVKFVEGYDAQLAHQLFAAGAFVLVPSRFEPCGLTQMQGNAIWRSPYRHRRRRATRHGGRCGR
jgi:starch synthase